MEDGPVADATSVLGRVSDGFFAVDRDWTVVYSNRRARELLGYEDRSLVGENLWEEFPGAVETTFHEEYRRALETQETVTFEAYYEPLDAHYEVRAYPSETGLSVYFRDVSDRRRAIEELERRESALRELYRVVSERRDAFEGTATAILGVLRSVVGTDHGILSRVEGEDYHVVAADPGEGIEVGDVVPLSATYCERTVAKEGTLRFESVADRADLESQAIGPADVLECYLGTPVYVHGDLYGTLCFTSVDATEFDPWDRTLVELVGNWVGHELERREDRRELATERDRLEEFASVLSHDLRNPLEAALGHAELATDACECGTVEGDLAGVRDQLHRMEDLVENVLTLARRGDAVGDLEPVALSSAVEAAWSSMNDDRATLTVAGDPGTVRADESRLRQLLVNLFRNSVEHSSTGNRPAAGDSVEHSSTGDRVAADSSVEHGSTGDPGTQAGGTGDGGVEVRVGRLDDATGFYVADDGPGIPRSDRDRVFESGYSSTPDGTGLGLAIVETVAGGHGWTVRIAKSEAGGARVEVLTDD